MDRIASKMAWGATAVALFLVCLAGCETNDVLDPQGTDDGPDPQVTCETLSGAITEDTTLSHPCYEVTGTVEVIDGATLTIDAGVTLKFAEEVQMTVSSGSLVAVGTADEPITFTGMESTRGYWGGLRFTNSNSTSNALRYVTIEYGGGYWDANLIVTSGATGTCKVAVSDCTLRESGTYGFLIEGYDTTVTTFANNTVTGNAMGAGKIAAKLVGDLDDSSTYTGNDEDIVWIFAGTVETDQTWPAIDVPYYVDTSAGLYIEADLTISPGATLQFADANEKLDVIHTGSLHAVGTAADPITFAGAASTRGSWGGVRFTNSNSTSNVLHYVTIEYGGGYWDANLIVTSGATGVCKVAVSDCTLRESGTYGFLIEGYDTTVSAFANNTITGNAMGAGKIAAKLVGDLDDSSTYTGNDEDIVWIFAGTVETDQTWPAIDVPYHVDTSAGLYITADLTISPGATLEFADTNERLYVAPTGSLYAVGTAANPITLTGATLTAGSWGGVRYDGTQSASNRLEYVEILYGGGYYFGNLDLAASSQHQLEITVGDCTFSHSSKWGVSIVQQYVTVTGDIAADNTFSDNALGDVEYR